MALTIQSKKPSQRLIPRWLKLPDAVAYSGISKSQLYNFIRSGKLQAAKVKGRGDGTRGTRLVDRLSLDRLLESFSDWKHKRPVSR
jgi:hypothetical protein